MYEVVITCVTFICTIISSFKYHYWNLDRHIPELVPVTNGNYKNSTFYWIFRNIVSKLWPRKKLQIYISWLILTSYFYILIHHDSSFILISNWFHIDLLKLTKLINFAKIAKIDKFCKIAKIVKIPNLFKLILTMFHN